MLSGKTFLATLAASAMLFLGASSLQAADTGTISGTVTGKDGKPAAGVAVRVMKPFTGGRPGGGAGGPPKADAPKPEPKADEPKPGEKPAPGPGGPGGNRPAPIKEGKTDEAGKFTLADVPVGDYMVIAGSRDNAAAGMARENVTVKAGETATVSLTLKEGGQGGRPGGRPGGPGGKPPEKPADGAK